MSLDLAHNSGARRVASFGADFASATLNSSGTCAIVCINEYPEELVGVLNLATGAFTKLDIRSYRAFFSTAESPSWNPDETAFAFSASGWSGEGDVLPRELWVRTAPPCP